MTSAVIRVIAMRTQLSFAVRRGVLWLAVLFTACSRLGDIAAPRTRGLAVSSVELSSERITVTEGGTFALQATARDQQNRPLADRATAWSSGDTTVASISPAGLVTGVRSGTALLSASVDGVSATALLTVVARRVATVEVSPTTPIVQVGRGLPLLARTLDETGLVLTNRPVTWRSEDTRIATVDLTGFLTGISPGVVTITATSGAQTATIGVVVRAVPVATVQLVPAQDTISVGEEQQLIATPRDSTGARLEDAVGWSSSNAAVATVTSSGLVLGAAPGTSTIAATSGSRVATVRIVVRSRPVSTVVVSLSPSSLSIGQSARVGVQITDQNGTLLTGRPTTFVSSNAGVARVSADGVVTAVGLGNTIITVHSEGRTGSVTVSVVASPVASVRLTPATLSLVVGRSSRLVALAFDAQGSAVLRALTWTSGAPSVLSVAADGAVTALAVGTALVFVQVEGQLATAMVTVTPVVVTSVALSPPTSLLVVGAGVDLTATARDGASAVVNGRPVQWTSANPVVAVVSNTGRVRAVAPGTTRIEATVDGVSGVATITVAPPAIATISVQVVSSTLAVPTTTQATAVARDAQSTVLVGRALRWSSSNTAVAIVSATGVVTAVSVGVASITATGEGVTGAAVVTVTPAPVASVVVSLQAPSVFVGGGTSATATLRDAANNPLPGRAVLWSSANTAVATISATGVVSALAVGTTSITASAEGRSGAATLTVRAVPVASVSVSLASAVPQVGTSTSATAITRDAANVVLSGRAIDWRSTNTAVATVSAAGVVTAVGLGSASIVATSEGRSGSASLVVTGPVTTVSVSFATPTVFLRATTQASALLRDAAGTVLSGRAVVWSSSNGAVATVSASGVVSGVAIGSATITATSEGKIASAPMTVVPAPVATVTATLAATTLIVNMATLATAVTRDALGNQLVGRTVSWSSSDEDVATVDANTGIVRAVGVGTATISATSETKTGSVSIRCALTPPSRVSVAIPAASPMDFAFVHAFASALSHAPAQEGTHALTLGRDVRSAGLVSARLVWVMPTTESP